MQYKISSLRVKNFKCFDSSKYYEFIFDESKNPIILTGPNGFGKTTFFDAIELLFSSRITRFETKIENKSTNLLKNILLNKADEDGYIIVALVNANSDCLTVFAKIDHNVHKLMYNESIKFGIDKRNILSEELDVYFSEYTNWKSDLSEFNVIKYSPEHFDVYYYVSQAESVHFLKKSISERKNSMNVMLDMENAATWQGFILDKLIGKKSNSTNVIINDEIERLKKHIDENITMLRECGEILQGDNEYSYEPLIICDNTTIVPYWDMENLTEYSLNEMEKGIDEVKRVAAFSNNRDDYATYLWNMRVENAITDQGIGDLIRCITYITDDKVDIDKLNQHINSLDKIIEIYNRSIFFRTEEVNAKTYKVEDMKRLEEIDSSLIVFDIQLAEILSKQIGDESAMLSERQSIIGELENAREALRRVKNDYAKESPNCPFCNNKFPDVEKLNEAFEKTRKMLDEEKGESLRRISQKKHELSEIVNESKQIVQKYLAGYDNDKIRETLELISMYKEIKGDKHRIKNIELLFSLVKEEIGWKGLEYDEQIIEIRRLCMMHKKVYEDNDFSQNMIKYNYESVETDYAGIVWGIQDNLLINQKVDNKIGYIRKFITQKQNENVAAIKAVLKNDMVRLSKFERIRKNFSELEKLYSNAIEQYKNQVLKKLRIPLLIYTGKILQDYQNGLGVFISRDEMRFVATGDAKHDILNTFSSGQLSGFVLAFLFSMNKQYIKESEDDIGFILIDDPVQTMDDINISSMIEVLRNDFADRQIIISTHEIDKENYILYKFFKYNQIGQSFNVKDSLYDV